MKISSISSAVPPGRLPASRETSGSEGRIRTSHLPAMESSYVRKLLNLREHGSYRGARASCESSKRVHDGEPPSCRSSRTVAQVDSSVFEPALYPKHFAGSCPPGVSVSKIVPPG